MTENEWRQAANHRDKYWLYTVYHCETPTPQLHREFHPVSSCRRKADWGFDPNTRPETFDEMLERQEDQTTPLPVPDSEGLEHLRSIGKQLVVPGERSGHSWKP
jgi:hypothetical protein